jgi:alpha-mannosidase
VIAFHTPAGLLVVNPTSFERQDVAFWGQTLGAGQAIYQADGTSVPTQHSDLGTWLAPPSLPPYSVTPLFIKNEAKNEAEEETSPDFGLRVSPSVLENRFVRVELDAAGDIVRLYDKQAEREVLPPGTIANQFQAFEDRPLNFEAWDIDSYFEDKHWLAEPAFSVQVVEEGPLRATLEVQRRILHSTYTQRISLGYNSPAVRFETVIDWQEKRILLKTAFPVDVLAPAATYEVQWGHVSRPTHHNTSWDWARFETCAQKWVDLSEGDYGVSLLNDCKYGHDIKGQVMRLSLLRSPMSPDATADEGEHYFSYVLLPHQGGWEQAGGATIAAAYRLNNPLLVADGTGVEAEDEAAAVSAWLAVDAPNVVIETIKQAEDGAGVIVRLYESQRRRGSVTLTAAFPVAEAWRTNLLEENETPLEVAGRGVSLAIKPFEIVTVRLVGG